jgi:small-conductance mechanosensitive channel
MTSWWIHILVLVGLVLALAATTQLALWIASKALRKRLSWMPEFYHLVAGRLRLAVVLGATSAISYASEPVDDPWWPLAQRLILVGFIISFGWLSARMASFGIGRLITRFSESEVDTPDIRRMTTQLQLLRRLTAVIIGVLTIGVALFTFPQVQALGAGVLASAGVLGVIGGLAAQATLGNLFAGIQLTFSNAIRVGDVVVVEGEWGRIGEITLSYVVVYIWDDRRLVVPSTYFTSKHFETWTRHGPQVLGVVVFDLDWRVPIAELREFYEQLLSSTPLWDGRAQNVLVTDSTGGYITVRCVASAKDSSDQWDLRCLIREKVVEWVREQHPEALPLIRVSLTPDAHAS